MPAAVTERFGALGGRTEEVDSVSSREHGSMLNVISDKLQVYLAHADAKVPYMNKDFKARMKRLRLRAGFRSQGDAAIAIGCERGTVSMWEAPSSAVSSVGADYLLAVAKAYKVKPSYINVGKGDDAYPWTDAGLMGRAASPAAAARVDGQLLARAILVARRETAGRSLNEAQEAAVIAFLYERFVTGAGLEAAQGAVLGMLHAFDLETSKDS